MNKKLNIQTSIRNLKKNDTEMTNNDIKKAEHFVKFLPFTSNIPYIDNRECKM